MSRKKGGESVAVYALTAQGAALGSELAAELGGRLFAPRALDPEGFEALPPLVADVFRKYQAHVFIAATGIAVRAIARHIRGKDVDPAVVVVSDDGRHVIPLLSGHLGGANDLAERIAAATGGQAVITTATDLRGLPAIDLLAKRARLVIADVSRVKGVSAALLAGRRVAVFDPHDCLELQRDADAGRFFELVAGPGDLPADEPSVFVHWKAPPPGSRILALHPRALVAGIGCRKGAPQEDILEIIRRVFCARGLALQAVGILASVDIKAEEPGLLSAAAALGARTIFYPAEALSRVATPTPSAAARKHLGIHSVSEAAALLAAGGPLLVPKVAGRNVTVAVALITPSESNPWAA